MTTTTASEIREAVERLARCDAGKVHETAQECRVIGAADSQSLLGIWRHLASCECEGVDSIAIKDDALDSPLDLSDERLDSWIDQTLSISIRKRVERGRCYSFFPTGLKSALRNANVAQSTTEFYLTDRFSAFATYGGCFVRWHDPPLEQVISGHFDHPRMLVRDLQGGIVPATAGIWMLRNPPVETSPVLDIWKETATKNLLVMLPNEVWSIDGETFVRLHGPRKVTVRLGVESVLDFDVLHTAVRWVYENRQDAEIRHTFITNELAREWIDGQTWADGLTARLAPALEGAQIAYRSHLQGSSRETVRMLTDLKRSLNEETAKVAQHTRDLTSNLWRDFALAVGALALRITTLTSSDNASARMATRWLLIALAGYLAVSVYVTLRTNHRYFKATAQARDSWHRKLYGFLTASEFSELTTEPLAKVETGYNRTAIITTVVYSVTICTLLLLASDAAPHLWLGTAWKAIKEFLN